MSFDIFLFKFSRGEPSELSRDALCRLFQKHEFRETSQGFYNIRLPDGSEAELQAGGLTNSEPVTTCTFYTRGMSDSIVNLVFESAQVTGGVLIATMDQEPCILVDASQRAELPPDFNQPLVECRSAEDLARLLRGGYQQWSRYRVQIVQGHDPSNPIP
jgi:hypothetical protein